MKTYHIGLLKGSQGFWRNGHRNNTVVVQCRRNLDNLDCELWKYYGERVTTKRNIEINKIKLLAAINKEYGTAFTHIIIN